MHAQKIAQEFFLGQLGTDAGVHARRYLLQDRGLSEKMIEQAGLGFGGASSEAFVGHLKKRGVSEKIAIDAGLLKQGHQSKTSHFLSRITFPIRNFTGQIIAFGGRSLGESADGPKYVNTHSYTHYEKRKSFYGLYESKDAIQKGKVPILVEGYFDAMALWASGMPALALCGTALSLDHVKILYKLTARVYLCFDQDEAGMSALKKALPALYLKNISPGLIALGEKDPGAYLSGKRLSELKVLISKPDDALCYLIEQAAIVANTQIHERLKQIDELMPIFSSIRRPLLRRQYVAHLAKNLHEDANVLWREIETHTKRVLAKDKSKAPLLQSKHALSAQERLFFEIVLADSRLFSEMSSLLVEDALPVKNALEILFTTMAANEGRLIEANIKEAMAKVARAQWWIFLDVLENRTALSREEAKTALEALKVQF
ncbi:MAG TPA: toprim domain-containing protein, partial [Myxococcota bacterium]|nr:toprim domain-containing protein [Myxococcota bacterium]